MFAMVNLLMIMQNILVISTEAKGLSTHTRSAILPTHSPFAVTSPIFSPLAKALYIGVRVDVDVTAPTFY